MCTWTGFLQDSDYLKNAKDSQEHVYYSGYYSVHMPLLSTVTTTYKLGHML